MGLIGFHSYGYSQYGDDTTWLGVEYLKLMSTAMALSSLGGIKDGVFVTEVSHQVGGIQRRFHLKWDGLRMNDVISDFQQVSKEITL